MIERIARLTVDGADMPPFLCTPASLDELAVGYLRTQGYIGAWDDIESVCVQGLSISVATRHGLSIPPALEARLKALPPAPKDGRISLETAIHLMRALAGVEVYYGTHCLALKTPETIHFREDIGRHNAMDKIIGRGMMDGVDFSRCIAAATGRVSLEMLIKAATAGIPFIVSKKYPSDLSCEIAEGLGITLIGRALSGSPVIYSAPEKVWK